MSADTHDIRPGDDAVAHERADDAVAHERAFDRTAQRFHAQALAALAPQTLSRLRTARHGVTSAKPIRRGLGWILAASSAAVLLLAVSVQLQRAPVDAPLDQIAATEPIDELDAAVGGDEYRSLVAGLDENPDLYLWLAANHDALPLPTER